MDTPFYTAVPPPLPPPLPSAPVLPPLLPQAPRLGRSVGVIAIYFVLQIAISFFIAMVFAFGKGISEGMHHHGSAAQVGAQAQAMLLQPDAQAIMTMLTLLGSTLWVIWWIRRSWPTLWPLSAPPGLGVAMPGNPGLFALAAVLGLVIPMLGGWMTQLFAGHHPVTQDIKQVGTQAAMGLRVMLAVLLVSVGPLAEELMFRGVLLSALLRRFRVIWAVVICSLAFVALHLPGLQMQWYALPELLLLALALAWLRLKSGSIWPSLLTHAINNGLALLTWFVVIKPTG